jgi:hypothetical protein
MTHLRAPVELPAQKLSAVTADGGGSTGRQTLMGR